MVDWWLIVPDAVAVALCGVAAVIDLRHQRIPNWLTVPGFAAGLLVNAIAFTISFGFPQGLASGLGYAIAGGGIALLIFFILGAIGAFGMGDVKLMAAVGALLGWPLILPTMVFVLIAGGLLSLGYALGRGTLRAVIRNIFRLAGSDREKLTLHRIPYGLAIFAGCLVAVLARHLELSLPFG